MLFYSILYEINFIYTFLLEELLVVWFDTVHVAVQGNVLSILLRGVKRRPVRKVLAAVCL